jgi:hypothetical protein
MTSVGAIRAQNPKNHGEQSELQKGGQSCPKKQEKWPNDELGDR